jgi:hypothetical protein
MEKHDRRHDPGVPEDPSGIQEPHDVLAAEEFGIGTRDERYPADPTGIEGPHDVLAAEEFAMPSPAEHAAHGGASGGRALLPLVLLGAVAAFLFLRRARR